MSIREGIYVHFLNSIELRGRSPERVARSHQEGKKIADIQVDAQFVTIRYFSEPTRQIRVGWNNVSYIESWDAVVESKPIAPESWSNSVPLPPGEVILRRAKRPSKPTEDVQNGQT